VLTTTTTRVMNSTMKSSQKLLEFKEGKAPKGTFDPPGGYTRQSLGGRRRHEEEAMRTEPHEGCLWRGSSDTGRPLSCRFLSRQDGAILKWKTGESIRKPRGNP